jgi:hypothetical protein
MDIDILQLDTPFHGQIDLRSEFSLDFFRFRDFPQDAGTSPSIGPQQVIKQNDEDNEGHTHVEPVTL